MSWFVHSFVGYLQLLGHEDILVYTSLDNTAQKDIVQISAWYAFGESANINYPKRLLDAYDAGRQASYLR